MKDTLLAPLVRLYEGVLRTRNTLYDRGVFKERRLAVPVASVGALTVGGAGKTPFAEVLARTMHDIFSLHVAVLSRGYGRARPSPLPVVVSDGTRILAGVEDAGDEPMLLAQNLLGAAAVVVCPSRTRGGAHAMERLGAAALVLDDGFQHRAIARDANLLLVDGEDFLGNEKLFPSGPLRESASALARADAVIFVRTPAHGEERACAWLASRATEMPRFFATIEAGEPVWTRPPRGKKIAAFCGIARPSRFKESLARLDFEVAAWRAFPDHHRYAADDIAALVSAAREAGAEGLLMTQKDWVKTETFLRESGLPAGYVPLRAHVREVDAFRDFLRARLLP